VCRSLILADKSLSVATPFLLVIWQASVGAAAILDCHKQIGAGAICGLVAELGLGVREGV